ncbi:hypothetical protein ASZ90_017208 [hydrocarbon metagenome]|uniref:Uncharacterized protein n=1 Tax=hydrocarbon metagenome TaxID=938273 RepID=A0A0W8E9T4_9ZZZZ
MKKKLIVLLIFMLLALLIIPESLALFQGEIPISGQIQMAPEPEEEPAFDDGDGPLLKQFSGDPGEPQGNFEPEPDNDLGLELE